jgi:hypothetical protein
MNGPLRFFSFSVFLWGTEEMMDGWLLWLRSSCESVSS